MDNVSAQLCDAGRQAHSAATGGWPASPSSHLILIPSYNTGRKLVETVREARSYWEPVWVVVDGSTDGSGEALQTLAAGDPGLKVLVLPHNQGKGAAVLHGLRAAAAA